MNPPGVISSGVGVYRHRSYDNLQNGKLPCRRNMNLLRLSTSYDQIQLHPTIVSSNIPSRFEYFSPQNKLNHQSIMIGEYPFHKNRAVTRRNYTNDVFYSKFLKSESNLMNNNVGEGGFEENVDEERQRLNQISPINEQKTSDDVLSLVLSDLKSEFDPMINNKNNNSISSSNNYNNNSGINGGGGGRLLRTQKHYHSSPTKFTTTRKPKRYSSVYEYSYKNDLNSIHEDSASDT